MTSPTDSAKGVSYYEIGFPDVLRPPTQRPKNTDNVLFHAYSILQTTIQEALDLIYVTPATKFILLNHFMIDEDFVKHFSVKLNLPHQECLETIIRPQGTVLLTPDQVNTVKVFNTFIFAFTFGRQFMDSNPLETVENKTKGYYVMPMVDGAESFSKAMNMIDWKTAIDLLCCKLSFKKWMHYNNPTDIDEIERGLSQEYIILRSGLCKKHEVLDALITYGPFDRRCFVVEVSKQLCSLSPREEGDGTFSYMDHWLNKRYGIELKHPHQPLLVGYALSNVGNFLQQSSQKADWCISKLKRINLPPEVCILHTGIKGCLWRGAFCLPSILCGLENALLGAQLRNRMNVSISANKVLEALTSGAYNLHYSYERLELIGDSFLTLLAATAIFLKYPEMNKDTLAISVYNLVNNKQLFKCAEACGLQSYIFNEPFQIKEWIPPGPVSNYLKSSEKRLQMGLLRMQRISWRTLADVVEAVIGLFALEGNVEDALKAMAWMKIDVEYPGSSVLANVGNTDSDSDSLDMPNIAEQLGYHFKNHTILAMALSYQSDELDCCSDFSRLAYLGDCIISHYVARHFITQYQSLSVGTINEMKQSVVNKENLAYATLRNGLHHFLLELPTTARQKIEEYKLALEQESKTYQSSSTYGFTGLCAPKCISDLISSIAAAIYLDSQLNGDIVWEIFRPLLEPLPTPECFALHPINELTSFCKENDMLLDIRSMTLGSNMHQANVIVNNETIASFEHQERRIARKSAAIKALHKLKSCK